MKYGVLVHKHTQNLGDDIQSFAISQHLPSVDYMVDREELDTFQSENNEPVSLIMSAWWLWKRWNWPPASCILPKLTGMHVAKKPIDKSGTPIFNECFEGIGGEYLKSYGPVGCRDYSTIKMFKEINIDAYFSGCITLTLPKMEKVKLDKEYICLVDVDKRIENKIRKKVKGKDIEIKIMTHNVDYRNSSASWEERAEYVKEILTVYQNAKCVITRRLHVALPCLAMDVPVLCIWNNLKGRRFSPYKDWLCTASTEQFLKGKCDYDFLNPKENLQKHLETREILIQDIKKFIDDNKDVKTVDDFIKTQYTDIEKMEWQNQLMKETLDKWLYGNRDLLGKLKELLKVNEYLMKQKKLYCLMKSFGEKMRRSK